MAMVGLDSSVLSCFARARRLATLDALTAHHHRVVTPAVLAELERGCPVHPDLAEVLTCAWLTVAEVTEPGELAVFEQYIRILGSSDRNVGESSILAWAESTGGIVLIDDEAAVQAGRARGVAVGRSLSLVVDGLKRRTLSRAEARALVDELIEPGGARFPCDGNGFEAWAERNGIL